MRQFNPKATDRHRSAGFSLVELLVVMFIIGVMAAVALPSIGRYVRNFRIKGATQQVAMEINQARSKAIMKNVNLGVVFAVVNSTQYGWVIEDDQLPQTTPNWRDVAGENWATLVADPAQAGTLQSLPTNVSFDDPANCNLTSGSATWGLRFTQLGSTCAFGAGSCGDAPPGATAITTNYVRSLGSSHAVCLKENTTNLRRTVAISSGGRVLVQP